MFIPLGDPTGEDETCPPFMYDRIADDLISCGGREWPMVTSRLGRGDQGLDSRWPRSRRLQLPLGELRPGGS